MSYQSDAPLTEPEEDQFGRWPFAERLAETIAEARPERSRVVGLYGAWGEGKTTLVNFVDQALSTYDDIVSVRFNPWRYGDEVQLVKRFFDVLAKSVGADLEGKIDNIRNWLEEYGGAVTSAMTPLKYLGVVAPDAGKLAEALPSTDLEELREKVNDALAGSGKQIVVFIDDIDRLEKREVQTLFRLVKLTADFAQTTYVLAFDPKVVSQALEERYSSSPNARYGHDFLEKIIEIPLQLPQPDGHALLDLCFEGMERAFENSGISLSEEEGQLLGHQFEKSFLARLRTPRLARRVSNALNFALPLLKNEVNPIDHALVESMRILYPKLYEHIRRNPDVYLRASSEVDRLMMGRDTGEEDDERREKRAAAVGHLGHREREAAETLVGFLFPQTALYDTRSNLSEAQNEQRVASPDYFERYFQYGVVGTDVSDKVVADLVENASEMKGHERSKCLGELLARDPAATLKKISKKTNDISPESAESLAHAVASKLGDVPNEMRFMRFSTADTASFLIADLLENVPQHSERSSIAKGLLKEATPLWVAVRLAYRLSPSEKSRSEGPLLFSERQALISVVAKRISKAAEEEPPHVRDAQHAATLYDTWAQDSKGEVRDYLQGRLSDHPDEAPRLIQAFTPWAISSNRQGPHPIDFERKHYERLKELVDPDELMAILRNSHGKEIEKADYRYAATLQDTPASEVAVHQFAALHRRVKDEEGSKEKSK